MSSEFAVKRRVARKRHYCYPDHVINPGDVYLVWTDFKGSDAGWADTAGHPVQISQCADCARSRHAHLLGEES